LPQYLTSVVPFPYVFSSSLLLDALSPLLSSCAHVPVSEITIHSYKVISMIEIMVVAAQTPCKFQEIILEFWNIKPIKYCMNTQLASISRSTHHFSPSFQRASSSFMGHNQLITAPFGTCSLYKMDSSTWTDHSQDISSNFHGLSKYTCYLKHSKHNTQAVL
jgi:hypothetical protein